MPGAKGVIVATNDLTFCHFASKGDFVEELALGAEVECFDAADRLMVELHLEVAVKEVAVGARVSFLPILHEERGLALGPQFCTIPYMYSC